MSSAQGANPEYVNARIRARRAKLFDDEDYRKLVRMGPGEISRYMEESEYETEMNALGSRYSGVDLIEYALNRNLAENFEDVLDWAGGRLYDQIAAYLRKFDVWNVKTVLRGLYSGASREEIESDLIRAGEFDERFLDRLLEAQSIEGVVELLDGTIFEDGMRAAFPEYEETDVLVPLENAVDRAFYEHLLDEIGSYEPDSPLALYAEFMQAEIDFRNARNALRLARSGTDLDPEAYFIEGGVLFSRGELSGLVSNRSELVARIRESEYGDDIGPALAELEDADSLIGFERALDAALQEYADSLSHVHPISISPVLAYVIAKEREVDNIRAIARGREAGLDEDEIEQELVTI
ncbi:V-type ATP synthase subunit C [Halorubellus sp. JP-L1]|uniref:V-type ATP synthase subunit C n=1 Tax=Halorubellus sp. JP-L1 TaxID=2715753 RepID=UPI00140B4B8B|nr:V-type ATP synthase subunit C [Halorubellus sp. JP-L1]NHN41864.1 V-type ATP synthase subunit C [Halorubellus sp. JP-L1]